MDIDEEELFDRIVLDKHGPIKQCEGMGGPCPRKSKLVLEQNCRTNYADGSRNTTCWLCPDCAYYYHKYWDDTWADYHQGALGLLKLP